MTSIRPVGIAHAAAALRNIEMRQAVIANNLANVSTTGFKGERVFAQLLDGAPTATIGTATDLRAGAITATGQPLDLAIDREGFFVVDSPEGERWTRGGALSIDERRLLVDATGTPLLGEDDPRGGVRGPVVIPATAREVRIDPAGAVLVDGTQIARLRVERPLNTDRFARLEHLGGGHVLPTDVVRLEFEERSIRQGALEQSNVGTIESMVDLIAVQRAYGSVQKVLTTIDSVANIAVTQIGKPA